MTEWDSTVDFVVVGSGGGGMVAALTADEAGASVIVLEKQELVGGSTAMSGGVVWVPDNPVMRADGIRDSYDDAMAHFEAVVGDVGPASSFERRHAYLTAGPEMISFLQRLGVGFVHCLGYSDYYSSATGGLDEGRAVEPVPFDGKVLGEWLPRVAARPGPEPRAGGDDERGAIAVQLQPERGRVRRSRPGWRCGRSQPGSAVRRC